MGNIYWENRKEKFQRAWEKIYFDLTMCKETLSRHDVILEEAGFALMKSSNHESEIMCLDSEDPIVRQGWKLKKLVEEKFHNLHSGISNERILIHVPDPVHSPAGFSLFTNLAESLEFIGIPTRILEWNANVDRDLEEFSPTVLLSSDDEAYRSRLDWVAISRYQKKKDLYIGLTASLQEYGNSPLPERLAWAKDHGVKFYFTFRDEAYISSRESYKYFFDSAYPMLYLPFGANVLHYYPVVGFKRDINYVLMATRKAEHIRYMKGIVGIYSGFIDGPGWKHVKNFIFNRDRDRYIYARACIGLNVHLPEQLDWACEVNERTFQLAACGVPQLIDHPLLLDKIFSADAMFIADSPKQYVELFSKIINNPHIAQERALIAQREVFMKHSTFHRADSLMNQLASIR